MIRQIHIDELEVGMYVEKVDRPWLEIPFFRNRIGSKREIERLREYNVRTLYIDTDKGKAPSRPSGSAAAPAATPAPTERAPSRARTPTPAREAPRLRLFDAAEVRACREVQERAVACVSEVHRRILEGEDPDAEAGREVVDDLIENLGRHPGVLGALVKLRGHDEYTFTHSVNVAVYALTLAQGLNCSLGELKDVGLGALFHDLGKLRIPPEILGRPGPLSGEEMALVRRHPVEGAAMLRDIPGVGPDVVRVALEHHERTSGQGYPRGLSGGRISEFGLVAGIADVYDAMTSERVYQSAMSPFAAVAKIYAGARNHFDPSLVEKFITRVGIYPVGSLVRLDSGEIGVVSEIHRDHLLLPVVLLVRDRRGAWINPPDRVDLLFDHRRRRVQSVVPAEEAGLDPARLLE